MENEPTQLVDFISAVQQADLDNVETVDVDNLHIDSIIIPKFSLNLNVPTEWMIDDSYAIAFVNQLQTIDINAFISEYNKTQLSMRGAQSSEDSKPYVIRDGVAYINIGNGGGMTKRQSCMSMLMGGGGSYLEYRQSLRAAAKDPEVKSIALLIDSPGGEISGCFDVANDIYNINAKIKPIDGYIEDVGCSAALLIGSQVRQLWCNDTAHVGSKGAYTVINEYAPREGIKIHVITSGRYKAIGVPGTKVTDEQLAYTQNRINTIDSIFSQVVVRGRGLTENQLAKISDAQVFIGSEAKKVGLIDKVDTIDNFHSSITSKRMQPIKRSVLVEEPIDTQIESNEGNMEITETQQSILDFLTGKSITSVSDLQKVFASADFGTQQETAIREQVSALAVVALGAEDGGDAKESIMSLPIQQVQNLSKQYLSIGKNKGLINESGVPLARVTAQTDSATHGNAATGAPADVEDKSLIEKKSREFLLDQDKTGTLYVGF